MKKSTPADIDVNTLRMVLAVADSESYTRAAQKLRVTQPAVSRRIALIEQSLRAKLFRRDGHRFLPTEVGLSVCDHARQIVSLVDALPNAAQEIAHQPSGPLALGVPALLGERLLPQLIPAYRTRYPDVYLRIEQGVADFSDMLMAKQVDVAVVWGKALSSMIELTPLVHHDLGLIYPRAWQKRAPNGRAIGKCVTLREIADLPLLAPAADQGMRVLIEDAFHAAGVLPRVAMEVNGLALIRSLVRAGVGCTCLAQAAIGDRQDAADFGFAEIRDPSISWTLSIATRKHGRPTLAARLMMQMIRAMIHDMVQAGKWHGRLLYKP